MKKIHRLVISSFIGPFVMTFAISLFFLIMQFIWLWVDELIGKGLGTLVILEIIYYAAVSLVPMALPLAVLLASVMTFGNLSEHFELTAMKTSGISLWRIMSSLILFIVSLSIGTFFFSNNVLPYTNLKYAQLLYDITRKKPEMSIKPGVFNNEIDGFSIKVDYKKSTGGMMYGFMIYDHTGRQGNNRVTVADSGYITITSDQKNLVATLYSGSNYNEMKEKEFSKNRSFPFRHDKFLKETIIFQLPDNSLKKSNDRMFKKHYEIMNTQQLSVVIDSLKGEFDKRKDMFKNNLLKHNYFKYEAKNKNKNKIDSSKNKQANLTKIKEAYLLKDTTAKDSINISQIYYSLNDKDQLAVISSALRSTQTVRNVIESSGYSLINRRKWLKKHQLAWYKKFSLSFACLIFFFVGAPLGAIIRKGGFGLPFLVSTVLFMLYYVLLITGEKAAVENALPVVVGAWLPSAILTPLGIYITYKASKDSKIVNTNGIENFLKFIGNILKLSK